MKTRFRKITAVLLAVLLACCMSAPAFALVDLGGFYDINVTGSVDQLSDQEITVFKILDIMELQDLGEPDLLEYGVDYIDYDLNVAWLPFVLDMALGELGAEFNLTGGEVAAIRALAVNADVLFGENGPLLSANIEDLLGLGSGLDIPALVDSLLRGTLNSLSGIIAGLVGLDSADQLLANILNPVWLLSNGPRLLASVMDLLTALPKVINGLTIYVEEILGDPDNERLIEFANMAADWLETNRSTANGGDPNKLTTELLGTVKTLTLPEILADDETSAAAAISNGTWAFNTDTDMITATITGTLAPENGATPNLEPGMYVFNIPGLAGFQALAINVPSEDSEDIQLKVGLPTVDKQVAVVTEGVPGEYGQHNSATIGDTVSFKILTEIPSLETLEYYDLRLIDTLGAGFDYTGPVAARFIAVTDGAPVQALTEDAPANGFTFDAGTPAAGQPTPITFALGDLLGTEYPDVETLLSTEGNDGVILEVTYSATLNNQAVVAKYGADGVLATNPNRVIANFRTDATGGYKQSYPDYSNVYTYNIVVDKFAADASVTGVAANDKLNGAYFVLSNVIGRDYGNADNDAVVGAPAYATPPFTADDIMLTDGTLTDFVYDVSTTSGEYVAVTGENAAGTNGYLSIQGLGEGTYYLYEVKAPFNGDGSDQFNKLTEPVVITIDPPADYASIPAYTTMAPGATDAEQAPMPDPKVEIRNGDNLVIPGVGGVGTVGLTILGVIVIAGGVIFTSRGKKGRKNNQ